ncbi:hypothetical protein [uncultured Ruegeria sp.]|uniref:hypothetical protein n=1 Tax=uncultured Ruegeria sp. TaxID=259304 RepID=UPI00262F2C82|nr:hypothetical protein [uncultured Ruegeria sp.]
MKKVLIASATVFAIVASAGMSMAGPLRDQGQRGFGQKVHASASQAIGHASEKAKAHQTTYMTGSGTHSTSKYNLGQKNQSSAQQTGAYGASGGSQAPNVVVIPIQQDGSYTLVIGKSSGSDLTPYPRLNYYW